MTKQEVADYAFKRYPQENTVYITSDKQAFFTPEQAEAHAPRLKDKSIETFTRKKKVEKHVPGTELQKEERLSGEGLAQRPKDDYDAPGENQGAEKPEDGAKPQEPTETAPAAPPVEYSMNNTKAELLAAAKGLEVTEDMTKAEILAVLYPDEK